LIRITREKHRYWFWKRTFDIIFSTVVLLVFSPLYLLLALIIFLDDPHGSPFYTQIRIGRKGQPFKFYKFRSMVVNADELKASLMDQNDKEGPVFKIKDDPRITRVGRFIRRTSLDELPQFWNVLKGDMTLVGPRPALPEEVAQYNRYHKLRQLITPGLTCYWQIQPNRDDIPFDEWIAMDIQYIRDKSFLLDLKLILLTVKAMFDSQGH
jgi:lipopolysaccharide/colanic/teichoic acid biosynthesis glycosyltransferase